MRSVALAFILKQMYGQDAVAASWRFNNPTTLKLLAEWADAVIVMQPKMVEKLPMEVRSTATKLFVVDVGEDRYGYAFHPELQQKLQPIVAEWAARDWKF